MDRVARVVGLGGLLMLTAACAAAPRAPGTAAPTSAALPEVFESEDFIVTFAKAADTAESLATRFLGDPSKAWMIVDYNRTATPTPGQEIVIPKRPWNPSGVEPDGFQLVPILVYHNLASQSKGRLVLSAKAFEEQMRYLKGEGYRVIGLREFLEFTGLKRQLPKKTVVLTFDDGWKSFKEYAYPLVKELGFAATLFIYTDFVGTQNALSWAELRELQQEGFDIQAHTKTHGDLRRRPGESDGEYAKRMQTELVQPLSLFQRHLGRGSQILAYPYGAQDEDVLKQAKEAGYIAAFTVRRQGNPSFVRPLAIHRSQIYSEMTLEDFAKNLNVFNQEAVK